MRDIRQDLRDRLVEIDREIADRQQDRQAVAILLDSEERRWLKQEAGTGSVPQVRLPLRQANPNGVQSVTVRDVINELLNTTEEWSTVTLANAAISRGCDFSGSKPGRAVHGILLGMLNSGHVERVSDGKWRIVQRNLAAR
jgi:hypothetical protein